MSCGLDSNSIAYGFAFVDCAALKFWTGVIKDDASCAALGALLMQVSNSKFPFSHLLFSFSNLIVIRASVVTLGVSKGNNI